MKLSSVGQAYKNFKLQKITEIKELCCVLRELQHLPSGAEVMHLACDDDENLFNLSFRTLPENSNGVAHVLEHTVLCGSKKFPIKDPFFAMTRRSLNTFMNALTGSDFTCYPASSQIEQDFYNLLQVYLDAVFHPILNPLSFMQEGHRLEFSIQEDPNSPLIHKGIVFNEMKGALTSGSARLAEALNKALFPNLPYGYNSGGDPKEIQNLTYQNLVDFHKKYYHPSRCLFFFYGNLPLEGHLDFIEKHALQGVKKVPAIPPLPRQPRFLKSKKEKVDYPIFPEEDPTDKTIIGLGWLTCDILNQEEMLALNILAIILMDTDASPLKQAFLKSGLCKQATLYMDNDISEVPVTIVLKGCSPDSSDKLELILRKTLNKILHDGISAEAFENAMHQLEFARSEIGGNHAPFGLSLFMRSALLEQHGGKPEDGLMIHSLFDQLRNKQSKNKNYLAEIMRKYFIDNTHFVSISMNPNPALAEKEVLDEASELQRKREKMTTADCDKLVQQAKQLLAFQKKQEEMDIEVLPKIHLKDVPKASKEYDLSKESFKDLNVFHHPAFTNNIVYADLLFDLPHLDEEDLPYARLFTIFASQIGCGGRNYQETLEYVQAHTGGVSVGLASYTKVNDFKDFKPSLYFKGKALHRNVTKLFPLLYDLTASLDFSDHDRIKEILLKHYTGLHSTLSQNALRYAMNIAASGLDVAGHLTNVWYGIEYYRMIKKLATNIDNEIIPLIKKMEKLKKHLTHPSKADLIITSVAPIYEQIRANNFYGLDKIKARSSAPWKGNYATPFAPSRCFALPASVAFTSRVFKTLPYVHTDTPALTLAACLFDNITLHARIREQGGAYGGGATANTLSGNFGFFAYRDPAIVTTLSAFDESIKVILQGDFDQSDLEEAKLEVIQGIDAPVAPGSRGELAYTRLREGKTPQVRQAFRTKLLSVTKEEVMQAVKEHIQVQNQSATTIIFAGKDLIDAANKELTQKGSAPFPIETIP